MKKGTVLWMHAVFSIAFALYLLLVIQILLFKFGWVDTGKLFSSISRSFSEPQLIWDRLMSRGNLIPFHEIRNYVDNLLAGGNRLSNVNFFGNIIAFLPFGFLLPFLQQEKKRSLVKTTLLSFFFSLWLETTQLLASIGTFDVDDLLLNTAGGMLGYLIYQCFRVIFMARHSKKAAVLEAN